MRRPTFIARQSSCPSGLLGRLIGWIMARETFEANGFALELLDLQSTDRVLEVGFGHGATIARIAAAVKGGFIAGVDPSEEMCRVAAGRNREAIESGRVELKLGRAQELPYADQSFDKALSVHTVYFWPDLLPPLAEVRRVLRPGGRVLLAYRTDAAAAASFPASVYKFREAAVVLDALGEAGFSEARTYGRENGDSMTSFTVARRPAGSQNGGE